MKKSGLSQSDVLRQSLEFYHALTGWEVRDQIMKVGKKSRKLGSTTPDEKRVINQYRVSFKYTGRIHTPAVLSAMRKALSPPAPGEEALTHEDLIELMKVAPCDELLQNRTPAMNEILTEKMIARLLVLRDQERIKETTRVEVELRDRIKPDARRRAREALGAEGYSMIWDFIDKATTKEEVESILQGALEAAGD
jgi:hypothetical protein